MKNENEMQKKVDNFERECTSTDFYNVILFIICVKLKQGEQCTFKAGNELKSIT